MLISIFLCQDLIYFIGKIWYFTDPKVVIVDTASFWSSYHCSMELNDMNLWTYLHMFFEN